MTGLRLFLDRSIGTRRVAAALREASLDVETIADRYGAANTHIKDEQWIAEASQDGRMLVGADKRIRYRTLERLAICVYAARCVTFAGGNMTADAMIALFLCHVPEIREIAKLPGPYVYHLTPQRMTLMALDCSERVPE